MLDFLKKPFGSAARTTDLEASWPVQVKPPFDELSTAQIEVLDGLRRANPYAVIMINVPLSRFMRVSRGESPGWQDALNRLRVDFLVVKVSGEVIGAVSVSGEGRVTGAAEKHIAIAMNSARVKFARVKASAPPSATQFQSIFGGS